MVDSAGDRKLVVNADLNGSIGNAGWNALDTIERRQLLEHLVKGDNAANNKKRKETITRVRYHDSLMSKGERPPEKERFTFEEAVTTWGNDKGAELYDLYQFKWDLTPAVESIKVMPETQAKQVLDTVGDKLSDITLSSEGKTKLMVYHASLDKARTESMFAKILSNGGLRTN